MLKPINEVSKEERLERAILVIEGLCLCWPLDNSWNDSSNPFYRITHAALQKCNRNCPVMKDGLYEIEEYEKKFKEERIIDIEEVILNR